MILTRGDVKEIVAEAFEILIECEEKWGADPDMTSEKMQALIRAWMKEWREREL